MKRRTTWLVAAALAVSATGGGALLLGTQRAAADPSGASPFAGSYTGSVPGTQHYWAIGITERGTISGISTTFNPFPPYGTLIGDLDGRVEDGGAMSYRGHDWFVSYGYYSPATTKKVAFHSRADVSLDASGNVVGTTRAGVPFTWFRQ